MVTRKMYHGSTRDKNPRPKSSEKSEKTSLQTKNWEEPQKNAKKLEKSTMIVTKNQSQINIIDTPPKNQSRQKI